MAIEAYYNFEQLLYVDVKTHLPATGEIRERFSRLHVVNGILHNTEGPADITFSESGNIIIACWLINGNDIEEFDDLLYEDLTEAQKKKLEFYKLKYGSP